MAAGCTVIASRTAPVEDVVTDGRNGFLADFFDTDEIATRVDQVLGASRETARVRERARRTVVEGYDLRRVCLPRHLKLLGVSRRPK